MHNFLYIYIYIHTHTRLQNSTSQSTVESALIQGKSKEDLKELARQIMLQVTQMRDDQDNASPASSEASYSSKQAKRTEPNPYLNSLSITLSKQPNKLCTYSTFSNPVN